MIPVEPLPASRSLVTGAPSAAAGFLISGVTALLPDGPLDHAVVAVEGGRIRAVGRRSDADLPAGGREIDGRGGIIAAGLIDLQLNGGFGADFTDQPEAIWRVGAQLPRFGVTAFVPTIVSSGRSSIDRARAALAAPPAGYRGATPLGLHLEGPYLNPAAAGAHDASQLRLPDASEAAGWTVSSGVRMVTLAPELPGALEVANQLAAAGVLVAAGHSAATYEQGLAAIDAGVRYATHIFNAMPAIDRRSPGLAAALLEDERVCIGLIPDGIHLQPAIVRLVHRLVGDGRLSAVTDATAALGMADGSYSLAGRQVELYGGRVSGPRGELAGSALAADEALRRLATMIGCTPSAAIAALTSVPARLLGMAPSRGVLSAGSRADLVVMSADHHVAATFVGGEEVYAAWD
jgi:N-acetylglucosamine-6-phosphate deacetylase